MSAAAKMHQPSAPAVKVTPKAAQERLRALTAAVRDGKHVEPQDRGSLEHELLGREVGNGGGSDGRR